MKEKYWTIINYALIAIAGLFGFYISNGFFSFGSNGNRGLNMTETIIGNSVLLLAFAALIIINIIRGKYRPNWVILGILGFLFTMNTINILCFKSGTTFTFTGADNEVHNVVYQMSIQEKVTDIFSFLATMGCALLVLDFCHKVFDIKQFLTFVCLIAIACVIVFIVISYFLQGSKYLIFYKHLFDQELYHTSISSVFTTKNSYATVLFIGILACVILHCFYRKWYYLAISGYIFINIIHTISKAIIILSGVLLLGYLIYIFFTTYKKHKKMNLITLAAIGGTILLAIIFIFIYLAATDHFVSFFKTIFYSKGVDTFKTRIYIWQKVVHIISHFNWITGCGHILFGDVLHSYNLVDTGTGEDTARFSAHSGYLQYIGEGGIIYLLIVLALIGFIIYLGIKNYKKDKPIVFISLSVITLFLIYMGIESSSIFIASGLEFGIISVMTLTPILFVSRQK